ncbi:MAG: hypothetical protein RLZZ511_3563 [Cyanobacteriota bacterium]|jgi:hypothetical protein
MPFFTFPSAEQLRQLPATPPILAPAARRSRQQTPAISVSSGFQVQGADLSQNRVRDRFGQAIALSTDGQILAVGAPHDYTNGHGSGAVQVYQANGDGWQPLGAPIHGPRALEFVGWAVALAADGQTLAIAAPGNNANGAQSGAVQLYRYQHQQWQPLGGAIPGGASLDLAGAAIALSADGQTIAIGATHGDHSGPNHGQVQVYRYRNEQWEALGNVLAGTHPDSNFGSAIAIAANGETLAIGAAFSPGVSGPNSGAVHLYQYNADTAQWQPQTPLLGQQPRTLFGHAVALAADGQTLAVSAIGSQNHRGEVYTYRQTAGHWERVGSAIVGKTGNEGLGDRLVLSGDGQTLSLSTSPDVRDPERIAHIRTYRWIDQQWQSIGETLGGGEFGTGLALSGDGQRLAIGAPGNEQITHATGQVRLLRYRNQPPQLHLPAAPQRYRQQQPPLNLFPAARISDDSGQWQGSRLSVTIAQAQAGERLTFNPADPIGFHLTPTEIWADNQAIGRYSRTPTRFDFQFNNRAKTPQITTVLNSLHYDRDQRGLPQQDRQIQLQLSDREGSTTQGLTRLKHVSPQHLLFRHRRSQRLQRVTLAPGSVATQLSSRTVEITNLQNQPVTLTEDWRVVGSADLDQDGIADLVLHSRDRDEVQIWRLDSHGQVQSLSLRNAQGQILRTGNRDWQLVGLADLNSDQQLDLVWQNRNADAVAFWQLGGRQQVTHYDFIRDRQGNLLKTGNAQWQIQGVTDFDGDGDRDLLYRLPELNHTAIVRLDQSQFIDAHLLTAAPAGTWTIAATHDGNGDGISDLYWQSPDRRQVQFQAIMLNDGMPIAPRLENLGIAAPLAAIGDLNQDAVPDLLLQDLQTPNFKLDPRQWDGRGLPPQTIDLSILGQDWEVLQVNSFGND